jgi:hypothetical protein
MGRARGRYPDELVHAARVQRHLHALAVAVLADAHVAGQLAGPSDVQRGLGFEELALGEAERLGLSTIEMYDGMRRILSTCRTAS